MAEIIGLAASILGLIEVSSKVISHSGKLIREIKAAPKELHLIHIEALTLKGILNSLQSLHDANRIPQNSLEKLQGWNGLVDICGRTLAELDKILSSGPPVTGDPVGGRDNHWMQPRFDRILTALKASRAKKLIEDVRRFTDLIKIALLEDFQHCIGQHTRSLNAITRGVADIQTTLEVKELDDLLHWISPLHPSYRQSYLAARAMRYKDTGAWVLKTRQYTEWRRQAEDINLCISGPSGSGKTVLSALILQNLFNELERNDPEADKKNVGTCVLYYYFDLRDAIKNTTAGFYDALVRQLLQYNPLGYADVLELAKKTHRTHPDATEYIELIKVLLMDILATSNVFLVIDGFDPEECTGDYDSLLHAVSVWKTGLQNPSSGASCDSSRPDRDPRFKILVTCRTGNVSRAEHVLSSTNIPVLDNPIVQDIQTYVRGQVHGMPPAAKKALGETLLENIIQTIVRQSDNLFLQAKLHLDFITSLETVSEIEQSLTTLPRKQNDTYADLLRNILTHYPGAHNRTVLRRMFLWLCQAKYCLQVSEFIAVTTLTFSKDDIPNCKVIPWDAEAYCMRLGPFLNIDRRPSIPEINLPHVTMEEFLQGSVQEIEDLADFYIDPPEAQRELAEFCIKILGSSPELENSITRRGMDVEEDERNPFKALPGGLGVPLDSEKHECIAPMQKRLGECPGLEYAVINWHHHLRNVFYVMGDGTSAGRERRLAWVENVIVPLLGWFLDGRKDSGRYRSWCETHAYFCHDLEEDCGCAVWRGPDCFLEIFGLRFLLSYVKGGRDGQGDEDPVNGLTTKRRCSECEVPVLFDDIYACGTEEESELTNGQAVAKCASCLAGSKPLGQCGRSFKLFQRPGLKWRAMKDLERYGLGQVTVPST